MPNNLESLDLEEVSLVDNPSCAETDPRTGRKIARATVALAKRDSRYLNQEQIREYMDKIEKRRRKEADDPGTQDVDSGEPTASELSSASVPGWQPKKSKKKKGTKKMKKREIFESVLKGAVATKKRSEIAQAVQLEARRIARKTGVNVQKAEADVWESNPQAHAAYDAAPVPNKPEQKTQTLKLTPSEVELHRRARKLMKSTVGLSYAKACSKALEDSPELYRQYTVEVASGKFVDVPDFQHGSDVIKSDLSRLRGSASDSDDDDTCDGCGEEVAESENYCPNCGRKQ